MQECKLLSAPRNNNRNFIILKYLGRVIMTEQEHHAELIKGIAEQMKILLKDLYLFG
jgi:hypothetical protein